VKNVTCGRFCVLADDKALERMVNKPVSNPMTRQLTMDFRSIQVRQARPGPEAGAGEGHAPISLTGKWMSIFVAHKSGSQPGQARSATWRQTLASGSHATPGQNGTLGW
jgi:hypothetical protein